MYYTCSYCKKIFQYKSYLVKHNERCKINREKKEENFKNTIKAIDKDIIKEDEMKKPKITKKEESNIIKCDLCNFPFKRKDYLKKHLENNRCSVLKIKQNEKTNNLEKQNIILRQKIKDIEKQIVFNQLSNINEIGGNVYTQNNIINQNITQNIQININNFGNENLSYLKNYNFMNGIKCLGAGIVDLTRRIHFNPEHPENQNIFLRNKRGNLVEVFENGNWVKRRKDDIFHSLISKAKDRFDEYFDENFGSQTDKDSEEYLSIRNTVKEKLIHKYEMDSDALGLLLEEGMNAAQNFKDFQTTNDLYKRITDDFHMLLENTQLIKEI